MDEPHKIRYNLPSFHVWSIRCCSLDEIDGYLSEFKNPMVFDESTVRKKLKEYTELGIIEAKKDGRKMMYKRAEDVNLPDITDVLNFYSEVAPCGVIGSFLLDKQATCKIYYWQGV